MKIALIFRRAGLCFALATMVTISAPALDLEKGAHIAFIGNSMADRMQHDGWLETYLHMANPGKELVIRNMGITGDRVALRPRNENFMNEHDYLAHVGADVVFAFFGYNESFDQDPEAFRAELTAFIEDAAGRQYNGKSAPQIVLISPVPFEDLDSPIFPDGEERNRWLSAYTDAMASVARRNKVAFVDLFYPMEELYDKTAAPLTINGVHLNDAGNEAVAKIVAEELFGDVEPKNAGKVRVAVLEKNWTWFNRYRATDGNDVWGSRAPLKFVDNQTNQEVLQHELVMLDIMSANRDAVIWQAIQGVAATPDDSNVPDPIMVKTNLEPSLEKRDEDGGHKFVKPEDGVKTLTLEKGMTANLFASEESIPEMQNPVQLDVDTKGRLWAAVWPTYPKWQPDHEMSDKLIILPDEDHDGVADKAITFAYVHNPTGFTFWNGGVLVASAPNIWFLKDTDGDDKADTRELWLSGLDSADTHHSANGFDYGPDGYLYFQQGIFLVSNVETPWEAPQLEVKSAMYRFNPRTFRFSHHADNPPNPHGGDFDYWGYHFATSATGGEAYQIREDVDGKFKMHKLLEKTVRPVPSSGIISSTHFPEKNNGNYIILNSIGFLGIKQYTLEYKDGVAWGTETDDLLVSNDSNFRPTDFKIGDDGAMYLADWSNPIIGHMQHNVRDPNRDHEHGRIYRITVEGRPLQEHVEIDGQPIEALLDVLKHPTDGVRLRARIELSERDSAAVVAAATEWVKQFDPKNPADAHHLIEALWLCQQHDSFNEELLNTLLASPQPDARRAAERVKYVWDIEGKFAEKTAAVPKAHHSHDADAILQQARDYFKQEKSPEPRMDGDVLEIHIQTLKERMRYDRTEFIVTPGLKVRLIFTNPDAMDHNLLMLQPGAATKVAMAAAKMETDGTGVKKQWNPGLDEILFASNLLSNGKSQTIEFAAPATPGRYDYICTFPGHWQLMRGAMVVQENIDPAKLASLQPPAEDPASSSRTVVAHWEFDMLKDELVPALAGRSYESGKEMFSTAACLQCHTIRGTGGKIGPDLTEIAKQYPPMEILQHILNPSLKVDDKYKTYAVQAKGWEYYGTIVAQDDKSLTLLENPLAPDAVETLAKADIEGMQAIDTSAMPTELLITLKKEEIWDLVAYVLSGDDPQNKVFERQALSQN